MRFRGVAKRGTLEFNGLRFTARPAVYEMTAEEAMTLRLLHGDRLSLEPLDPEPSTRHRRATETAPVADAKVETEPVAFGQDQ